MPPAPVRAFALAAVLPCPDGIASSSLSQPRPSVRCPCCCQNRHSAPAASWPRSASPASIAQRSAARRLSSSRSHRSEEHTSELQSRSDLVCRLLLEKKKARRAQRDYATSKFG